MAHMIDRMMYSGLEPWHGLGRYQDEISFEDAKQVLCTVSERTVSFSQHTGAIDGQYYEVPVDDYKAIVRDDTGQCLCVQKKTYGVAQYVDQLDVLNAAAGEGLLRLKTVGLLDSGRRCFALADIPSAEVEVAGHAIKPYLLMSTSHDSSRLLRYLFTGIYVVCNNTETAALSQAGVKVGGRAEQRYIPNVIQIRHTSRVNERIATAKKLIGDAREYFGRFSEVALRLVNAEIGRREVRAMAQTLIPETENQREQYLKYGIQSAPIKAQAKIYYLFEHGRASKAAPGTKWAAFNAVTEYIDHHTSHRGQSDRAIAEARFEHSLFETGSKIRQRALDYLLAA